MLGGLPRLSAVIFSDQAMPVGRRASHFLFTPGARLPAPCTYLLSEGTGGMLKHEPM